ncbi:unnamed protein product, partial [Coregonus sp. 'balchen']
EGSTDSLYEPALNKHPVIQEHSSGVPSQHNSPSLRDRAKWRGSDPCIPTRSVLAVEDTVEQLNSERREKDPTTQGVNFETWNPNYEPDSHQQDMPTHIILLQTGDAEADMSESKGTLKRFQRLVRVKKGSQMGLNDGKTDIKGHLADSVFSNDSPVITCIGLGKKTEKKTSKAAQISPQKQQTKETNGKAGEGPWSTGVHDPHWGPTEVPPPWDVPYHTCHRPPGEPWNYGFDFTLPRATAWDRFENQTDAPRDLATMGNLLNHRSGHLRIHGKIQFT